MATKVKKKMDRAVSWFEIPAEKLSRAKKFYENILHITMTDMDMGDSLKMTIFPVKEGGVGGALCQNKKFYKPSAEGTLVYLPAEPDVQTILDRVEENGGKIIQPRTQISDEYGYMAVIQDTEGNRVALHGMQ